MRLRSDDLDRALAAEQQTLQQVRDELEGARAERAVLTAQVATLEATARVLTAPATRAVALAGQAEGAVARARAFLSPDTRTLIVYAYDLPELPADRTYQAWVIPGSTPVSIGVFIRGSGGVARHEAADVAGLEGPVTVAVTIEPLGGLPGRPVRSSSRAASRIFFRMSASAGAVGPVLVLSAERMLGEPSEDTR